MFEFEEMVTLRSKRVVGQDRQESRRRIACINDIRIANSDCAGTLKLSFKGCYELSALRQAFEAERPGAAAFPMHPNRLDACCCVQCTCAGGIVNHFHRVVVVDTETTGVSRIDQIIEIAAVEVIGNKITGKNFHAYIRPTCRIHPMASRVHGFKNDSEVLREAKDICEVFPEFVDFVAECPIVCHNAAFDMRFLCREGERVGQPFSPIQTLCTYRILQAHFKQTLSKHGVRASLDNACTFFALKGRRKAKSRNEKVYHSALEDAALTAGVYTMLHRIGLVHICTVKRDFAAST